MKQLPALVLTVALLTAVGCSREAEEAASDNATATQPPPTASLPASPSLPGPGVSPTPQTQPPAGSPPITATPQPLPATLPAVVEAARADLAMKLGVSPASIQVVSLQEADWPDGCLGYARPAEVCIQVVTPGYRVVFADGRSQPPVIHEYHTDRRSNFRAPP